MYVPARADGAAHVTLVDVAGPIATSRLDLPPASQVILGRGLAIGATCDGDTIRVSVADPAVSREHVRLLRVESGWVLEDLGSKNGTLRLGAALRSGRLLDGDVFEIGATFVVFRHGGRRSVDAVRLVSAAELAALPPALASFHPQAEEEAARLAAVTRARIPLLLVGECGTDKALVAHALHDRWGGGGAIGPIDCAAQTPRTLEAAVASACAQLE
ncbi:MAG: FHA domain-containing protein, partial [Deltaproteobacteria bacterium]|nr:FHA domain-containing protein [Kofleriaceae bacterium]